MAFFGGHYGSQVSSSGQSAHTLELHRLLYEQFLISILISSLPPAVGIGVLLTRAREYRVMNACALIHGNSPPLLP